MLIKSWLLSHFFLFKDHSRWTAPPNQSITTTSTHTPLLRVSPAPLNICPNPSFFNLFFNPSPMIGFLCVFPQRGSTAHHPTTLLNMYQKKSSNPRPCSPHLRQTPLKKTHQVRTTHNCDVTQHKKHSLASSSFSCCAMNVTRCVAGCRVNSTSSTNSVYNVNSSQSLSSYNLSPLPAGPAAGAGAISMAAAQAVQATAQVEAPSPLPL